MATGLALIYVAALLQGAVFVGSTCLLVHRLGGRVTRIVAGSPALGRLTVRGVPLVLGPIPFISITIEGRGSDEPVSSSRDWRTLSLPRRLGAILIPWLLIAAIAAGCLGAARLATSVWHGWYQLGVPLDLSPLARSFVTIASAGPSRVTVGIVFAKLLAFSLFPMTMQPVGSAIREVVGDRVGVRTWGVASLVFAVWVFARLGYAVVRLVV